MSECFNVNKVMLTRISALDDFFLCKIMNCNLNLNLKFNYIFN